MERFRLHLYKLQDTIDKIIDKEEHLAKKRKALEKECVCLCQYLDYPCPETEKMWRASRYINSPWWFQRLRARLNYLYFQIEDIIDDVTYYAARFAYYILLLPLITVIGSLLLLAPLLFVVPAFFFLFSGEIVTSIPCFIIGALSIAFYKVLFSALRERSF